MNPTKTPIQGIPTVSFYTENGQNYAANVGGPVPTTIEGQNLGAATPVKLPPSTPETGYSGLGQFVSTTNTNVRTDMQKQQEEKLAKQEADAKEQKGTIATIYQQMTGAPARKEEIYKEEGVDKSKAEVDELTSQIEAEELSLRRRVESLRGSGVTKGQLAQQERELTRESVSKQADLAIIQSAALRKYDTARAIADRKIDAEMEPLKIKLEAAKFFYEENKADLTKTEERLYNQFIKKEERDYNEKKAAAEKLRDTKLEMLESASAQGAPLSVRNAIQAATSPEAAIAAAGKYAGDILDRQYKQAQIDKINAEIEADKPIDVSTVSDPNAPALDNNNNVLTAIFKSSKVSPANKTFIGNGMSLAKAAQDLVEANEGGNFAGMYPGRGFIDAITPQIFKRQKTISNEGLIAALDLQTQFWASGAALTEEQTKKVLNMVPKKSDTDNVVKAKTNQLVNYMLSQTSVRLQTDGITFNPQPVDLFETENLLNEASPEQIEALKAEGLLK